jgi:hypothetical protein
MWASIISACLPTLLKIIGGYIEKRIAQNKMKEEAREKFLAFAQAVAPSFGNSAKHREDVKTQIEELK